MGGALDSLWGSALLQVKAPGSFAVSCSVELANKNDHRWEHRGDPVVSSIEIPLFKE